MNTKTLKAKDYSLNVIVIVSIIIPLSLALLGFFNGHITFWYDNARDLYAAWDNLQKPTLIGPTSGIPGIFYGPYWIWLLSLGLLVSKDPLVVAFITATLPYFILFPLIWFRFRKFLDTSAVVIGWLLFMLSSGFTYATQLWNPYPAPLITTAIILLLINADFYKSSRNGILQMLLAGFLLGLLINFHISFGIAFLSGISLYIIWNLIVELRRQDKTLRKHLSYHGIYLLTIISGFFVAFIPTLLFELRHGFNQTQALIHTFTQYGAVVEVKGLSKNLILEEFGTTLATMLHVPNVVAVVVLTAILITFALQVKRKQITLTAIDKRMLMLLCSVFAGICLIYLSAKNPVWKYHFIGVDLLFVIMLTYFLAKLTLFRIGFGIWLVFVVISAYARIFTDYTSGTSYFYHQKNIIQTIAQNAGNNPYATATYTNSTYSHENAYLFRWLENKDVPSDPNLTPDMDVVYLVIPMKEDSKITDFINYRTPHAQYKTEKEWDTEINSRILKRVRTPKTTN